jgi:hypothetical protein
LQQRSQNTDVRLLSETWLHQSESVYLKVFDVVRKDRNERAGGDVAIFIINKLKYSRKDGFYDGDDKIEVFAIELHTDQDKILIVSCYRHPHMKIERREWKCICFNDM